MHGQGVLDQRQTTFMIAQRVHVDGIDKDHVKQVVAVGFSCGQPFESVFVYCSSSGIVKARILRGRRDVVTGVPLRQIRFGDCVDKGLVSLYHGDSLKSAVFQNLSKQSSLPSSNNENTLRTNMRHHCRMRQTLKVKSLTIAVLC